MNLISLRLLNQQLVAPQMKRPADVVAYMGAIQAQEYRMMRWAVCMRTKRPSALMFREDYDSGRIIRSHMLRCTWQLVAAEDYPWMWQLCASKALTTLQGWMHASRIYISDSERDEIRTHLIAAATEMYSSTKEEIARFLDTRGIRMEDHRLSYHIRLAELSGILCSGNLHPCKPTYSLVERKIPKRSSLSKEEALALLTRKYFQSHQPATLEDYVWWSGLNMGDCRIGIETLGNSITSFTHQGRTFYLMEGCRTRGFHKGSHLLIPPYDEYLIGYKSRDIVLAPEFSHHAHNNSGIFLPIIARDGQICGNWAPFSDKAKITFFLGEETSLDSEWNDFCRFKKQAL